jgi:hypothetical protein
MINVDFDLKDISAIMSSLYDDPANTYILNEDMALLANRKLLGDDISEGLIAARKIAYDILKPKKDK